MIDHIGLSVSNVQASIRFYTPALKPLGMQLLGEDNGWVGFGENRQAVFWFGTAEVIQAPMHIAFSARSRDMVDQFYNAAIAAGGKCNGTPGERARYHPHYYAAFVIDPDGHNVEAVCHQPAETH